MNVYRVPKDEMMATDRKTYQKGRFAEKLCVLYLRLHGYRILETRYKTPFGEIDVIAQHKNQIIFVEVKWRSTLDKAKSSITSPQKKRIQKAALRFMKQARYSRMRFDVFVVAPYKWPGHYKNVWQIP